MSSSDTDESLELMMKKAEMAKVLEDLIREIVQEEIRKDKNRTKQVETSCTTQEYRIIEKAIKHFGVIAQRRKFVEEAAEAIHEIMRHKSNDNITHELADLQIMLNQMKIIYPRVNEVYELKLESLNRRINEQQETNETNVSKK